MRRYAGETLADEEARLEDERGNAAVANGLILKAKRHFRVAAAIRREAAFGEHRPGAPRCSHCGTPTVTIWIADDELWEAFNGGQEGIACTECFVKWALNERGIIVRFRAEVVGE